MADMNLNTTYDKDKKGQVLASGHLHTDVDGDRGYSYAVEYSTSETVQHNFPSRSDPFSPAEETVRFTIGEVYLFGVHIQTDKIEQSYEEDEDGGGYVDDGHEPYWENEAVKNFCEAEGGLCLEEFMLREDGGRLSTLELAQVLANIFVKAQDWASAEKVIECVRYFWPELEKFSNAISDKIDQGRNNQNESAD